MCVAEPENRAQPSRGMTINAAGPQQGPQQGARPEPNPAVHVRTDFEIKIAGLERDVDSCLAELDRVLQVAASPDGLSELARHIEYAAALVADARRFRGVREEYARVMAQTYPSVRLG